jgi:hypothetical protein
VGDDTANEPGQEGDGSRSWGVLGNLQGADIEALAYLVLMEAARSAQDDLKEIMAEIKATNAAKRAVRSLIAQVRRDVVANAGCVEAESPLKFASNGLGGEAAYHQAQLPVADSEAKGGVRFFACDLHPGGLQTAGQLQMIYDELKDRLDSMSELGETESMRLQMAMDRRSKLMETLSNVMKKMSDTGATLAENLK